MDDKFEAKMFIISAVLFIVLCVINGFSLPILIKNYGTRMVVAFICGIISMGISMLLYTWAINTQGESFY